MLTFTPRSTLCLTRRIDTMNTICISKMTVSYSSCKKSKTSPIVSPMMIKMRGQLYFTWVKSLEVGLSGF